jgi:hypothetical protein
MGWEDAILPKLKRAMEAFPAHGQGIPADYFDFGKDRKRTKHLSPNHWEMGLAHDLLASAQSGLGDEWAGACDAYAHCLDLHLREIGLWTSEQFTGAPHGGFYLASLVAARMAAWTAASRGLPIPPALASDLDEYAKRTIQYLANTATPSGEIICCGERMPKGPSSPQASAFYRELMGMPHPEKEDRKIKRQAGKSDDFYWLSLRGLRKLIEAGDYITLMARQVDMLSLPFTSQSVTLLRYKDGHAAYCDAGGGDGTCEWVDVRGDRVSWGPRGSVRPRPAAVLFEVKTQKRGGESTMPSTKVPTTLEELNRISHLPFREAVSAMKGTSPELMIAWGESLYGKRFGYGFMHGASDHFGALEVLLEREPTFREVYDSWQKSGAKNIDASRIKSGGGARPMDWDRWTPEQKRYGVLVHRYGMVKGGKILDGKADPDPEGTLRQLREWNGDTGTKPEPDPVDPPVTPPPSPPAKVTPVRGTLILNVDGVERRFNLTEIA